MRAARRFAGRGDGCRRLGGHVASPAAASAACPRPSRRSASTSTGGPEPRDRQAGLLPPIERLRALAPSFYVEAACKRFVRPEWTPSCWDRDRLHEKSWPEVPPEASRCQTLHVAEAKDRLDWSRPAVLTGTVDEWPSAAHWSIDELLTHYGGEGFVIGALEPEATASEQEEDDEAATSRLASGSSYGADPGSCAPIHMTLEDYVAYAERQRDDCPLYIFDDTFLELAPGRDLAKCFGRPSCFQEDFMAVLGKERPPHRWLLIGTEHAGTGLHVDPLETAAWNTLVSGHKRWVLFAPTPHGAVADDARSAPSRVDEEEVENSAAHWIHRCYPSVDTSAWECMDFAQGPGETVYVPPGWWHNVVNLDFTIAVTENFVGSANLQASFRAMAASDAESAEDWRRAMEADPSLRELARGLPPAS